jgi:hypothetical protein
MHDDEFFSGPRTIPEIAAHIRVTDRFVTAEIKRGNLKVMRFSHSVVRATPEAIRAWMEGAVK